MGGRTARCFLAALALAGHAVAAEPAWPLGPAAQARIEELRRVIGDAAATAAQRQDAREELVRLLMSPSATGKTVALAARVRPELLGGVRFVVGSKLFDASVASRLDRLKKKLLTARD